MIEFMKELNKQFRLVTPESFHEKNRKKKVVYPYLTYDFDIESLERNVDGFYIDVDVFDYGESYMDLLELELAVRKHFSWKREMKEGFFYRFEFLRSNRIPTGEDLLKRRQIQLYCKIDWRN